MPLSGEILGGLIAANLAADGAIGPKLTSFSLAVGTGIVEALEGIAFVTTDVGFGPIPVPPSTGTGIGIIGLIPSAMAALALSTMSSRGPKAPTFMLAIMDAVSVYFSTAATLNSINPLVSIGTATITPGSFVVTVPEMEATILAALQSDGAMGPQLSNLSLSIATGVVGGLLTGTGILIIAGLPSLVPATGAGTGILT